MEDAMPLREDPLKYLPLSEPIYFILLALVEPLHGYGVMQKVEHLSQGMVKVGPGTLYGAFSTLESEKLIVKVSEEERRKNFTLTEKGRQVLLAQIQRFEMLTNSGLEVIDRLNTNK
jgi:DNA-binding PadR family transcriptional regulator